MKLRAICLSAAAMLTALGALTPAAAGGGHGRSHGNGHGNGHGYGHYKHGDTGYSGGWRYDGYRGSWRSDAYYGHSGHHYRYKRHRGGLSGAEAGLIAAGIVGAAILIDSASSRSRYDDERYDHRYRDEYDRYGRDDFYYRRDDRRSADRSWEDYRNDPLDRRLDGGRAAPGEYNYGSAYNDCKAEAREAARREGLTVGLPARPDDINRLDDGGAVRFVAKFEMQDRGQGFKQTMVCEADADGVRFLEMV